MEPLASSIPRKDLVNTDLPEPDSPTMASVSPWYKSREHLRMAFNFLPPQAEGDLYVSGR